MQGAWSESFECKGRIWDECLGSHAFGGRVEKVGTAFSQDKTRFNSAALPLREIVLGRSPHNEYSSSCDARSRHSTAAD